MTPPFKTKPFLTVFKWQIIATAVIAGIAGVWVGGQGAISALLGGGVNLAAGVVYAGILRLGLRTQRDAGGAGGLGAMFRAEAGKILVIVGGLWLVLSTYREVVPAAFFTAFVVTVIVFSMAFFVRD